MQEPLNTKPVKHFLFKLYLDFTLFSQFSVQTPEYKKIYQFSSAYEEFNLMLMRRTYFCGFETVSALQS